MNFLLKILQGPNAGAEIALVDGLTISIGKEDSCDIVLADPTLPDASVQLETRPDSVILLTPGKDQQRLENFHAVALGSTMFAVGPANEAWQAIVYPKPDAPAAPAEPAPEKAPAAAAEPPPAHKADEPAPKKRKSAGCLIIVEIVILILLAVVLLAWFNRDKIKAYFPSEADKAAQAEKAAQKAEEDKKAALDNLISEFRLVATNDNGRTILRGDFATPAERLAATARLYAAAPGIDLDFSDGETLMTAVADTLALVGEKHLSATSVTNRVAMLSGKANDLKRVLEAIANDIPKLENVDCAEVTLIIPPEPPAPEIPDGAIPNHFSLPRFKPSDVAGNTSDAGAPLPVCGILTTPYPCLVLRNGTRVLEGGMIGSNTVLKISSDMVILTNATGRVEWKP